MDDQLFLSLVFSGSIWLIAFLFGPEIRKGSFQEKPGDHRWARIALSAVFFFAAFFCQLVWRDMVMRPDGYIGPTPPVNGVPSLIGAVILFLRMAPEKDRHETPAPPPTVKHRYPDAALFNVTVAGRRVKVPPPSEIIDPGVMPIETDAPDADQLSEAEAYKKAGEELIEGPKDAECWARALGAGASEMEVQANYVRLRIAKLLNKP